MTQFQSVKWKILTPMILVFLLIMVFINLYSSHQQKARLLETTEQHLNQVLDNYLDGINMLMLTGSMASRDTLRDKFAQQDGVEEVRVLRAEAVNKVRQLMTSEGNDALKLRVFVSGGGCSGFSYGFTFDETVAEDDAVVESGGVTLLVDALSYQYLLGAEVGYKEDLQGAQFIITNPNAASTCGCGNSFAI